MAELSEADVQFVKDLRQAKEEGRISRRDALKVAGALGVGGVVGGAGGASMFGNAAAGASTSDSDGNVGLPGDRVDVFAEGVDAESIANNSQTPPRPLWLTSAKTVTVDPGGAGDYTTVQAAIDNEAPYFAGAELSIDLVDATYTEDVTVEGVHGDRGITSTAINITGNVTTPANVSGLSFAVKNCSARINIEGVTLDREHPFTSEQSGLVVYESMEVRLGDATFGAITNGVTSYAGRVEVAEVDFGTSLSTAMRTKHDGVIFEQSTNAGNITGSPSTAYAAISGIIYEQLGNTISATDRYSMSAGQIVDSEGRPRGEINVTAGSTLTDRHYQWGSTEHAAQNAQQTDAVSTTAKTILSLQGEGGEVGRAGCVAVEGDFDDAGTIRSFIDLVLLTRNGGTTVVGSQTTNTPATRTYSVSGSSLQLAMGANSYDVIASGVSLRNL